MRRPGHASVEEAVLDLVRAVAPRNPDVALAPSTDLGYGGYGLTAVEYLTLLAAVGERWGAAGEEIGWPRTVAEIVHGLTGAPKPGPAAVDRTTL